MDLTISRIGNGFTRREQVLFNLQNVASRCKNLTKLTVKIQAMNSICKLTFDEEDFLETVTKQVNPVNKKSYFLRDNSYQEKKL